MFSQQHGMRVGIRRTAGKFRGRIESFIREIQDYVIV